MYLQGSQVYLLHGSNASAFTKKNAGSSCHGLHGEGAAKVRKFGIGTSKVDSPNIGFFKAK